MTNLPITSSNSPSPARAPGTTQTNGMPDVQTDMQTVESFGALLAQQMGEAGASALITPSPAIAIDAEATADYAKLTSQADQDKTLATTDIPTDPASMLAAILHLPHEIKTPAHKDATNSTTAAAHQIAAGEAASSRPAVIIDATQAQTTKFDRATADHPVVRGTGPEITNSAALTNSAVLTNSVASANTLPRTSPPTQDVTPSITASTVMPNMLANNRLFDTRQTIATPLNNSGWADEFSQKINWISTQQNQVAELHLNPPDLGPLNVVLKISDNQATALFTSPHSAVRDAVENALPKLRETLADNGITLGNTTVSDQPPRDRDMERFTNQGSGAATQRDDFSDANLLTAAAQVVPARRHNGMVDIFA